MTLPFSMVLQTPLPSRSCNVHSAAFVCFEHSTPCFSRRLCCVMHRHGKRASLQNLKNAQTGAAHHMKHAAGRRWLQSTAQDDIYEARNVMSAT